MSRNTKDKFRVLQAIRQAARKNKGEGQDWHDEERRASHGATRCWETPLLQDRIDDDSYALDMHAQKEAA